VKDEIFRKDMASSFPSIEKTILHMCDAEAIWLQRLEWKEVREIPSVNFKGDKDQLLQLWIQGAAGFLNYITENRHDLAGQINYRDLKGNPYSQKRYEIAAHVCHHSTYHRGQIVTMLRQCGETEIPQTDLIAWYRKR
jgi:uncharacterized damage-inducible protein DinB